MKNLINKLKSKWSALLSNAITIGEFLKYNRKLYLITYGTLLCTLIFALITWFFNKYSITISETASNCSNSTDSISSGTRLILFGILPILFTLWIDRLIHTYRTKKHFDKSYKIVTKRIIKIYSKKTVLNKYNMYDHKSIDRIIKSPLDYAAETLEGNIAPYFRPNDRYLEDIFDKKVNLIIAVTAENPNLWLDPTLCFYLINCCAASLLRNRPEGANNLIIKDFEDSIRYKSMIYNQLDALSKLSKQTWEWASDLKGFNFFRFFLYDKEQQECLENTVFPSLKASHDLFNMKSYFNKISDIKAKLESENKLRDFYAHIEWIWDEIDRQNPSQNRSEAFKTIFDKRRNKEHLPEFLFLFKTIDGINSVTIHTYIDGEPLCAEIRESLTMNDGYQIVQCLVSYIAQSIKDIDPYIPAGKYLNTKNSYIEWN